MDYREIPVTIAGQTEVSYAKISPEDYERVVTTTPKWRVSSSGYVMFVKRMQGSFETTYLHKLVHGDSATHRNGDRFDNRRENLMDSPRGPPRPHKRKSWAVQEEDHQMTEKFVLHTPRVVCADMHVYQGVDEELPNITGFAEIEYHHGEKFYSGDIKEGKPHGYGHLYEEEKNMQSCGMWSDGLMIEGMVVTYQPVPDCLCEILKHCPLRRIIKLDLIKNGYRL
jgi:hypothetical protein